ncbi:hypothetical protein GOB94_08515 [Granulicella sp. 5B5]|uniref:hypothetical protein n=1 Tax=Granulicella sp. 5B5 TaxID=1617967 RepID=UPI0015F47CA6|nr:hypothetical protein [Granulicella sp. 5B5]QMV18718.1 hypothetical protein GOB94_08515 [Granulicella sp. 5B5]
MKMTRWMARVVLAGLAGFAVMAAAAQTSAPVKDDLFAGTEVFAKGASDVNEVTMDPDTLDMVGGPNGRAAHNMVLNVVRSYSYDKPGMYNMQDVEAFRNKLNTGDWHCSVHTRDFKTGESTDICNKRRADGYVETAIITVEPKELTFIHTIRKQRHDGDHSELDGLWIGPSMAGLPTLAMIAPQEQIHLDLMLNGLDHLNLGDMQIKVQDAMKNLKFPDSKDLQKQMDKVQKDMKEFQKNWPTEDGSSKPKDKQPE